MIETVKLTSPCNRYRVYLEAEFSTHCDEEAGYCQGNLEDFKIDYWEFDTIEEQPDEQNPDLSWVTSEYVELYGEVL